MDDIYSVLPQASLYLHLARGEAWGVAILEAMAAGLPAIVSEWTGAAEAVEQVWPEGVVPLSVEKATEAVVRYFSLTETEKRALSEKSATLIREKYRLSQAIAGFQSAFAEALKVVGLL
jgi:glycosyltransferase involved in cell wall biosynthesis